MTGTSTTTTAGRRPAEAPFLPDSIGLGPGLLGVNPVGHRHSAHSLLWIVAFITVAWVAGLWTMETEPFGTIYPSAGLLTVLLAAFAAKDLKIIPDGLEKSPWPSASPRVRASPPSPLRSSSGSRWPWISA
ncbi:hypothetical protein [Arthrobacter sp. L77]|uniref:hypothetical protein n=1 Tax=Arthrobacter sp. L77 TaxID=1496689 RepID=UPI0006920D6D|nr:hypothetical protein [Arthrobacter sp. L77]